MDIISSLMDPAKWAVFGKSAVLFVIVLGALVFFHEMGNFLVARWCGVTVVTFSLGFGPKLVSRKLGDTEYCLSLIPLGGYVRMLGDDPNETVASEQTKRSFLAQSFWKKAAIVVAGPLFNFLLALLIFVAIFMVGVPILLPHIGEVQSGSAAEAGLMKAGDQVRSIDGAPITQWEEIRKTLQKSRTGLTGGDKALHFVVDRGGTQVDLSIMPTLQESKTLFGEPQKLWLIGVLPNGDQRIERYNPFVAAVKGVERTWEVTVLNVVGILKLVQGKISSDNIGGPLLIAQMAGQQASEGMLNILFFVAVISINLGIMNLIPIPILDGGHLLFFTIEAVQGRPLSIKTREMAQQVGMLFLVSLMIFAFYNDIMRFLTK